MYLGAGFGLPVLFWNLFETSLFVVLSVPIASFGIALAYLKINEQPLANVLLNGFRYFLRPRLYIWKKKRMEFSVTQVAKKAATPIELTKLTESKLNDLAWSLDIKEKLQR